MSTHSQLQSGYLAVVTRAHSRLTTYGAQLASTVRGELAGAREDRGAAMAEYGILIFFVGLAAFGILVLFGAEVWELFRSTEEGFDSSTKIPPPAD